MLTPRRVGYNCEPPKHPGASTLMRDRLSESLRNNGADFVDVRVEERMVTRVTYRGSQLEEASLVSDCGGCVRALVNGGWGFVSFNDTDAIADSVARAVEEARYSSGLALSLPAREAVDASVTSLPRRSVGQVSLSDKKQLLDEYNDIIMSSPRILSSQVSYGDSVRTVRYASSDGSYIEQHVPDLTLRFAAIARDGDEVQQAGVSLGSVGDFASLEALHDEVRDVARRAAALLDARKSRAASISWYSTRCWPACSPTRPSAICPRLILSITIPR